MHCRLLLTATATALCHAAVAQAQSAPSASQPAPPSTSGQVAQPYVAPPPAPATPAPAPLPPVPAPVTIRPTVTSSLPGPLQTSPSAGPVLPEPSGDPLRLDPAGDPVLQLGRSSASFEQFRALVAGAVARHPASDEASALTEEARQGLRGTRERLFPSADFTVSSYRVLAREFSDDPDNIIERSRPDQRTDVLLSVNQTLFDFGATANRVHAASARLRAARAEAENSTDRLALGVVAAWYDLFTARALVTLGRAFSANQDALRAAIEERIASGVSAEGDRARVESYIASTGARLARFQRLQASAEARFAELTGSAPPAELDRAPTLELDTATRESVLQAARNAPVVRAAEAQAEAARKDARADSQERHPNLSVGVDAGRYGLIETARDFDVRARITLRKRFFGGIDARANGSAARARAVEARAARVREETSRDAAIALSDVEALAEQLRALEANYMASRRSRDVIAERFRVARGSLFDVLAAEDAYFETATAYVQALTELDAARYVLLSRTGLLLPSLNIEPPTGRAG